MRKLYGLLLVLGSCVSSSCVETEVREGRIRTNSSKAKPVALFTDDGDSFGLNIHTVDPKFLGKRVIVEGRAYEHPMRGNWIKKPVLKLKNNQGNPKD